MAGHATAATCGGRVLLECGEKNALFQDYAKSGAAFVLYATQFESPPDVQYFRNRALQKFWRLEAATAAARSGFGFQLIGTGADPNFQEIASPRGLPVPKIPAYGRVNKPTAAALTALVRAEQSEMLYLEALKVSLDRATAAQFERGREDWVAYQQAAAAGFARNTASALTRVIRAQKIASRALLRRHLQFGIGSVDIRLAKRAVHRDGLSAGLRDTFGSLGLDDSLRRFGIQLFASLNFGKLSFSLSQTLADPPVLAAEKALVVQLRHYASRIPPAPLPPS